MQNVQVSLLPFHLHRQTIEVPEGLTLQEYADHLFPQKIRGIDLVINIGDEVVPKSRWKSIRPKAHTLIGINAIPAGGKGGKKNPLAALISIALIVAAPYIAAAIAPTAAAAVAAGTATLGQTLTIGLIKIGISMVGFLATSMLSSVPKQRAREEASPQEASTQFIEGASNKVDRYGVIPVNLGTNRIFPPQAALPYTETVGNKQYVRQLFTYGFGKVVISDRRIGETLLNEYEGVEFNDRLGADLLSGVSLFSNDVFQEGFSITVSNAASYILRTTQRNVDEAEVDITFSNGLTNYNDNAQRTPAVVEFELQYAPTGTSNWTSAASPTSYGAQTVTVPTPSGWNRNGEYAGKYVEFHILLLDIYTGQVTNLSYSSSNYPPPIPAGKIRIASFRAEKPTSGAAAIYNLVDERSAYIGGYVYTSGSFAPTYGGSGLTINIAAGQVGPLSWRIQDSTAQALRLTQRLKFPSNGQYDIRIRRLTADSVSDRLRDVATLTAIRSIKYSSPILQPDISGTAMRIQATDQLNGTISSYNCIISTLMKDYDSVSDTWITDAITSNPASIFRYVLQSPAFVKNLPDNRINIDKLEEWHTYCETKGLSYNRIIDSPTSVDDLLNDIAAAGMATPHKINGVYSVIIDNERPTIKGMVTPRNSWGYNGQITYPDLPHALRVQFRNKDAGYNTDERIVYADGYNEGNATLFERLDFPSCTNADLAWFYGRTYLATALLQPEVHTFNMDFENLTFNRGDKIVFVNDSILVGVGQGRILELIYDNPTTPTQVLGFVLDETVTIPIATQFGVRIRYGDASGFVYHSLVTAVGETDEFTFTTPVPVASAPPLDSLCAFTEFGNELELVVTEIMMNKDHSARVIAVNYAPERFDAATGTIPAFDSNVTLPIDFYRPVPPEIGGVIQSDESVMIRNSDGSYTGRMIIPLINRNEPSVNVVVRYRPVGATQWSTPDVLSATPDQVIIAGLEDGSTYDISIAYQRTSGLQLLSLPLYLNGTVYEGASAKPADVTGFKFNSSESIGLFEWDNNPDIDISHYVMKFTRLTSGASWVNAQLLSDSITTNRANFPIQAGTYLIKAVDILGNESENATTIVSIDNGAFNNVVQLLQEQPDWNGTHVNTHSYGDALYLVDPTLPGYYYFDQFDLGDIYESVLSSSLIAQGDFYNRIRIIDSIRDVVSIRGVESNIIRAITSMRGLVSVRGIDPADWSVRLEMRTSTDGVTWSAWDIFTVGKHIFRYLELRIYLVSNNPMISPKVTTAEVLVDMPDRYESGEDVACPPSGAIITYNLPFRNNPAVNITLQNGAVDDKIEFVYKTETGFHVKVYNQTAAAYVTRSLDYHSAGYGRLVA